MRRRLLALLAVRPKVMLALLLGVSVPALAAQSLLGNWQCQGDDGAHTLAFTSKSKLVYDGETATYATLPNAIVVTSSEGVSTYGVQLQGDRLVVHFPDGSLLRCERPRSAAAPPAQAGGQDSARLQREIAGTWWGYSGGTERRIGLCPDGSYVDFTESGYSGRFYGPGGAQTGAWGTASQGGNSGRWVIEGNYQRGVIRVHTRSGGQFTLAYRQVGEPGCLDFNGSRLCRTSARCN